MADGQLGEARAAVGKALSLARERLERGYEAYALRLDAELLATKAPGGIEESETRYGEAMGLAEALGMRPLVARCHNGLSLLYYNAGQNEAAQKHLDTATRLYREMDMHYWLKRMAHDPN
jgi:tetratricopeptide (TPR) repeat protein